MCVSAISTTKVTAYRTAFVSNGGVSRVIRFAADRDTLQLRCRVCNILLSLIYTGLFLFPLYSSVVLFCSSLVTVVFSTGLVDSVWKCSESINFAVECLRNYPFDGLVCDKACRILKALAKRDRSL